MNGVLQSVLRIADGAVRYDMMLFVVIGNVMSVCVLHALHIHHAGIRVMPVRV